MTKLILKLRVLFLRFWQQSPPLQPELPAEPKTQAKRNPRGTDGPLYYLDNLLDGLDDYFKVLHWLRNDDPEVYDLYSRVGGQVVTDRVEVFCPRELTPLWRCGLPRPAFGMIHLGDGDKAGRCYANLLYFRKVSRRSYVQPTPFDCYEVVAFVTDKKKSLGHPLSFHISVDPAGNIKLLKERVQIKHQITAKKVNGRKARSDSFVTEMWRLRTDLVEAAAEHHITPQEHAETLFRIVTTGCEVAGMGTEVRVTRAGITAVFNIDTKRTPYFFHNRSKTVNVNGKTKPIFHIVRPHQRKDGSCVRFHFRGEREFSWNGYRVLITMPGWHHRPMIEFDVAAHAADDPEIVDHDAVDSAGLGDWLARHVRAEKKRVMEKAA